MSKIHAAITAVNGYVPEYVLTNQELETMVDTNDEWMYQPYRH
jgi:3-oxoacyl-[acyl-carrier-protein] synthase-3